MESYSQSLDLADSAALHAGRRLISRYNKPGEVLDRFGRTTTSEIAPDVFAEVSAAAKAGGKQGGIATRLMEDVGMSRHDIAETVAGRTNSTIQNRFEQRLTGFVNIEAGAINRPAIVTRLDSGAPGFGSFAWRFKQYPYRQIKVLKHVTREAYNGNWRPLARMAAVGIVAGEALNGLSHALYGPDKDRPSLDDIVEKKDMGMLLRRMAQDYAATGMAGLLGPAVSITANAGTGRPMALDKKLDRLVLPPAYSTLRNFGTFIGRSSERKLSTDYFRADGEEERESILEKRPDGRWDAAGTEFWRLIQREVAIARVLKAQHDRVRRGAGASDFEEMEQRLRDASVPRSRFNR